jgi:hypothetical protein
LLASETQKAQLSRFKLINRGRFTSRNVRRAVKQLLSAIFELTKITVDKSKFSSKGNEADLKNSYAVVIDRDSKF